MIPPFLDQKLGAIIDFFLSTSLSCPPLNRTAPPRPPPLPCDTTRLSAVTLIPACHLTSVCSLVHCCSPSQDINSTRTGVRSILSTAESHTSPSTVPGTLWSLHNSTSPRAGHRPMRSDSFNAEDAVGRSRPEVVGPEAGSISGSLRTTYMVRNMK